MKKSIRIFLQVLLFAFSISAMLPAGAADELSWYFRKNNEHKQPTLDEAQSFINGYSCYYADTKHGDDDPDKVIYLTFDAGYENGNVARILDTLRDKNVPGAFFVLRHLIEADTDLVLRMVKEGHLVCNHTMSHKNMAAVTDPTAFEREITGLADIFREKLGMEMPKYYRPPEGRLSENNLKLLEDMGYKTILWSFAYADWDNNAQPRADEAKEKLLRGTHNGMILLLHPTSKTNADILGELIDAWKAQGYRFGTLDEL